MSQTSQLLATLKQCLKSRGLTYAALGEKLSLSEASIKRLFSDETFSLTRLEEVCDAIGMTIAELAKLSSGAPAGGLEVLTEEQEAHLATTPKQLAVLYLLANDWDVAGIRREYQIAEDEMQRALLDLDKLRLIELHPGDRVRVLCSRNVTWRPKGLLAAQYEQEVKRDFLGADFAGPDQRLSFLTGELSVATMRLMQRKMAELIQTFNAYAEVDAGLPKSETQSVGILLAARPWVFSVFRQLKRREEEEP